MKNTKFTNKTQINNNTYHSIKLSSNKISIPDRFDDALCFPGDKVFVECPNPGSVFTTIAPDGKRTTFSNSAYWTADREKEKEGLLNPKLKPFFPEYFLAPSLEEEADYRNKRFKEQYAKPGANGTRFETGTGFFLDQGKVEIYENGTRIRPAKFRARHKFYREKPNTRGNVKGFSRWSRRRLMAVLGSIEVSKYGLPIFVSNTYHHQWERRNFKRDLKVFFQRIKRLYPSIDYLWRAELQKRRAPHFHVIFFPQKTLVIDNKKIENVWLDIVDPGSVDRHFQRFGSKILVLKNFRHLSSYVSKYVAKLDPEKQENPIGRQWGKSRKLKTDPVLELPIFSEDQESNIKRIFRKWLRMKKSKSTQAYAEAVVQGNTNFLFGASDYFLRLIDLGYYDEKIIKGIFGEKDEKNYEDSG